MRTKYNSLFLTNYRESKKIARKRISFDLVYNIVGMFLLKYKKDITNNDKQDITNDDKQEKKTKIIKEKKNKSTKKVEVKTK